MDKTIKEIIKETDSKNVEGLINSAYDYFDAKTNPFFAELFMRNALKISQDCGEAMDLLDRLGNRYYGNKKSAIDNHDFHVGDVDVQKLTDRLDAIKKHKVIYEVLRPVSGGSEEEIVSAINKAFLNRGCSAIALVKAWGVKYVDPEYMDNLWALSKRIENRGALDHIKSINKNILRNILNAPGAEIVKNNFKIDRNKFVMKFFKHEACKYCKSSVEDLIKFYAIRNPKRGRGLLWEIDRVDPRGSYEDGNYAFTCYYCNNAKADVFTGEEFGKTIGPVIGQTIKDALRRSDV